MTQIFLLYSAAWLLRLNEIVRAGGVLMMITGGQWDVEAVASVIGHRYIFFCQRSVCVWGGGPQVLGLTIRLNQFCF